MTSALRRRPLAIGPTRYRLRNSIMLTMVVSGGAGVEGRAMESLKAVKRLGRAAGEGTTGTSGSPDIVELDNGDFAVFGWDVTDSIDLSLLPGVHCAPGERTVCIDRDVLVKAKRDIPDA